MGTFHLVVSFSGQVLGSRKVVTPSRFGPRHCGQSWAERLEPRMRQTTQTVLIPPPRMSTEEVYNTLRRYFVVRRRANPRTIIPPPRKSIVAGSGVTVTPASLFSGAKSEIWALLLGSRPTRGQQI